MWKVLIRLMFHATKRSNGSYWICEHCPFLVLREVTVSRHKCFMHSNMILPMQYKGFCSAFSWLYFGLCDVTQCSGWANTSISGFIAEKIRFWCALWASLSLLCSLACFFSRSVCNVVSKIVCEHALFLIAIAFALKQKGIYFNLSLELSLTETNLLKTSGAQARRRMV